MALTKEDKIRKILLDFLKSHLSQPLSDSILMELELLVVSLSEMFDPNENGHCSGQNDPTHFVTTEIDIEACKREARALARIGDLFYESYMTDRIRQAVIVNHFHLFWRHIAFLCIIRQ